MPRDCKLCFYYTWESELLCAVEPELAQDSRNACECRHYDYSPIYVKNGVVIFSDHSLGYAVAVRLPYKWYPLKGGEIDYEHWESDYVVGVTNKYAMVTVDDPVHGFFRAVDLPEEEDNSPFVDTGIMERDD